MSIKIPRGETDGILDRIIEALRTYESDHPRAAIDLYRQNSVSVRIRIIDPDFAGQNKVDRNKTTWKYLDALGDDIQSDISTLILLTPEEKQKSLANLEFEDPVPSAL